MSHVPIDIFRTFRLFASLCTIFSSGSLARALRNEQNIETEADWSTEVVESSNIQNTPAEPPLASLWSALLRR